jgi:MoxR-like ATPase
MAKKNNINTDIFCELKVAEKSQVPVLFISNPGIGKTTSVYYFAKVRGYEVVLLRGNSTTAEEVMGYDVAPRDVTYDHKMAAINLRPSWFEEVLRNKEAGKKTLLFLDEITTANEFVQAALLHLIFERKVHTESLPEDTLIVSAGNYAQNLSNTMSLLPPVMNRFGIFNITPKIDDLDIFLNKYEGGLKGKKINYAQDLEKMMRELDKQEVTMEPEKLDKLGEWIERAVRECVKELINNNSVDMTVTDLQSIYADNSDNDTKLYGFVSFRTLNYLRDTAVAYYQCFGKPGINSNNFKNSIIGLCGCGVVKNEKRSGDVKLNKQIWQDFFTRINSAVSEFEKLNNNKLSEYEQFFRTYENKASMSDAEINALFNKLEELNRDTEIANIERPVDAELINKICDSLKSTALTLKGKKIATGGHIEDSITCEDLMKRVITWNHIADVFCSINALVRDANRKYEPKTDAYIQGITSNELNSVIYTINGSRNLLIRRDASKGSIIPEVKAIKR